MTIVFNATVNETEVSGQIISQFGTYLEELSDGKITLNVYWGGTVYDDATQFQAIRDGAVDMISINPMQDSSYLPYLSCMSVYGTGSAENVLNLFKALEFENEETAEIIQAEAAEYNLKYLNVLANGVDALYSTFEWDTLEEFMSGSSCVGSGDTGIFKLMGMNVSDVTPSEVYDALQRGICDSTNCALSAAYSMSWDEVASNIVIDGLWAAGNNFTINIDFWNTLSEGQQQIIQEAADRASDYSLELQNEMESTMIEEMESRSDMTIKYLSDEDSLEYYGYLFTSSVENSLNQVSGDEDATAKIVTILEFVSDYLGYDWEYEG
ncbi:MAG: TRAP transporter substrate-binding protein DctP [Oscillospiraceae bacterium]|nr:TRAP transporter substrate-binding protein DctP [Oscillospiraceae bacterium]